MKTKEPFKWTLVAILLLSLFTPVTYAQSPALIITDYIVQPEILTPGELGTVTVTIENSVVNASADITDIYLFAPRFKHDHKSFEQVGILGGGSSTSITFAFTAPKVEGIYFPEIHIVYRPEGSLVRDTLRYPFPVRVNERTSLKEVSLEVEKAILEEIRPGDDFTLSLKLTNRGETAAHDIFVEIGEVQAIYSNDPSNYYIAHLEPEKGREIQLRFRSSKDTPTGTIVIPIDITYEGLGSEVKKQSETAGIDVIGIAELSISNIKTDPLNVKQGDDFTLLVRIENAGDGDAKSVKATITGLPFLGVKEAFLGKIEPDDDSPAVFTLIPDRGGSFDYNLQISYKDDSGDYTVTEKMNLVVRDNKNGMINLLEGNGNIIIGVIVSIIAILFGLGIHRYVKRKRRIKG